MRLGRWQLVSVCHCRIFQNSASQCGIIISTGACANWKQEMTDQKFQLRKDPWVVLLQSLPFTLVVVTALFGTWFMPVFFYYPPWYEHVAGGFVLLATLWLVDRWFDD